MQNAQMLGKTSNSGNMRAIHRVCKRSTECISLLKVWIEADVHLCSLLALFA